MSRSIFNVSIATAVLLIMLNGCTDEANVRPSVKKTNSASQNNGQETARLKLWNTTSIDDLTFKYIPFSWDPRVFSIQMDPIWQAFGLNINGIPITGKNYFLFPESTPYVYVNPSKRFDPETEYFQSWFGMYTVDDKNGATYAFNNGVLNPNDIVQLALTDQIAWLTNFAHVPPDILSVENAGVSEVIPVQVNGYSGYKIKFILHSNIDTGDQNNPQNPNVYPYKTDPAFFTIPKSLWTDKLPFGNQEGGYDQVTLECVSYVWHVPQKGRLQVAYYNGIQYWKVIGNRLYGLHTTLDNIGGQLDLMARNIDLMSN